MSGVVRVLTELGFTVAYHPAVAPRGTVAEVLASHPEHHEEVPVP